MELVQIRSKINMEEFFRSLKFFNKSLKSLTKEVIFKRQKSLCLDVESVFLRRINIFDPEEHALLLDACLEENFQNKFLIIHQNIKHKAKFDEVKIERNKVNFSSEKLNWNLAMLLEIVKNYAPAKKPRSFQSSNNSKYCCSLAQQNMVCVCEKVIYEIRPYTFEFLTSSHAFFELIAYSNIPLWQLDQIANFFEEVLNKPVRDRFTHQKVGNLSERLSGGSHNYFKRMKKIEPDVFV